MLRKIILTGIVMVSLSLILPVHAVQLDAAIPKDSEEFIPSFQFTRIISIQYDEDSRLAELVGDKKYNVRIDLDSENSAVLIDLINAELEKKSFVRVSGIDGVYSAIIIPQENSVSIEFKMILQPMMSGHFVGDSTLDSEWRGFEISDAVTVSSEYGMYDINSPKSVLMAVMPDVLDYLSDSDAMKLLELKILDTSGLTDLPLSKWESMFDPTAKMSETQEYGFSGGVITNYSMGICTVYIGLCQDRSYSEEFAIDGEKYSIKSIESQDDATIILEGYVQEIRHGGIDMFSIADSAPDRGNENDTQVPIMYVMSGAGVALAVGFFVWSDKKSKKTSTEQTGIDPKNLCAVPIGSAAGSYQTNRVTAHLA